MFILRVLFQYWQYCEGVPFGFQGCIDQGFDVLDCVEYFSMRAVDEFLTGDNKIRVVCLVCDKSLCRVESPSIP